MSLNQETCVDRSVFDTEMPFIEQNRFGPTKIIKPLSFSKFWDSITDELKFDKSWEDRKDFGFQPLVGVDLKLGKEGTVARFIDPRRRKGIVVTTLFGNVVVYQQYSGHNDAIICRAPVLVKSLLGAHANSWLDYRTQEVLLGLNGNKNIGQLVFQINNVNFGNK